MQKKKTLPQSDKRNRKSILSNQTHQTHTSKTRRPRGTRSQSSQTELLRSKETDRKQQIGRNNGSHTFALIVNERVGSSQERADAERSLRVCREAITAAEKKTKFRARVLMKPSFFIFFFTKTEPPSPNPNPNSQSGKINGCDRFLHRHEQFNSRSTSFHPRGNHCTHVIWTSSKLLTRKWNFIRWAVWSFVGCG